MTKENALSIVQANKSNFARVLKYSHRKFYDTIANMDGHIFSEKLFRWLNDMNSIPICSCGVPLKFNTISTGYYKSCRTCSSRRHLKSAIEIARLPQTKQQRKNTMLKKYGVQYSTDLLSAKTNRVKVLMEKYNTLYPLSIKKIRDAGVIQKHDNFIKSCFSGPRVKGFTPLFEPSEFFGINDCYEFECNQCHTSVKTHLKWGSSPRCPVCEPGSAPEADLYNIVKKLYTGKIRRNARGIIRENLELDFYFPDLNIALEFNGIYWHSDKFRANHYHHVKFELCAEKQIILIQIYEDQWKQRPIAVESLLQSYLCPESLIQISSSNCAVADVSSIAANDFFNSHSVELPRIFDGSKYLGLYHNSDLISVVHYHLVEKFIIFSDVCYKSGFIVTGLYDLLFNLFVVKSKFDLVFSENLCWPNPEFRHERYNLIKTKFPDKRLTIKSKSGILNVFDAGQNLWHLKKHE